MLSFKWVLELDFVQVFPECERHRSRAFYANFSHPKLKGIVLNV